jgi:hypothetical protein
MKAQLLAERHPEVAVVIDDQDSARLRHGPPASAFQNLL